MGPNRKYEYAWMCLIKSLYDRTNHLDYRMAYEVAFKTLVLFFKMKFPRNRIDNRT